MNLNQKIMIRYESSSGMFRHYVADTEKEAYEFATFWQHRNVSATIYAACSFNIEARWETGLTSKLKWRFRCVTI